MREENKRNNSIFCKFVVCLMIVSLLGFVTPTDVVAASPKTSTLVSAAKKSAGSKYPFTSAHSKTSTRFVCGITASKLSSYNWYEKTSGTGSKKVKYILFVGKTKSVLKAGSAKSELKENLKQESSSMNNYLSSDGKKVFKNAQVGSKGSYVWAVAVSSSASVNKKVVSAMKKKM